MHLGCQEVYEPMNFVFDDRRDHLVIFDTLTFFRQLSDADRKKFSEICQSGTLESILTIYKFLHERRSQASGRAVAVCPGFKDHYRQTLALSTHDARRIQQELNNFTLARTAFLPQDQRPYIPGSAVKGVLRTAYLNHLQTSKNLAKWSGYARELEEKLLTMPGRDFATDPFRLLKVSDFHPVGPVRSRVVYAVNEKKNPGHFTARGPYQMLEVIEPGAVFVGRLDILDPPPGTPIRTPLKFSDFLTQAAPFFQKEKQREDQELFNIGVSSPPTPADRPGHLMRMGRHSGAELVTIEGHRRIKILQGYKVPPKEAEYATTLWLSADYRKREGSKPMDLRPFGWAWLEKLTPERAASFKAMEDSWRTDGPCAAPAAPSAPPVASVPTAHKETVVVECEVWGEATLTWNPGKQTITAATLQQKKATAKDKELVPAALYNRLFAKKKAVAARVTVEPVGNAFRIVKIEALS
jgi:CRISPR-associated protein Csm5